jgi:hypothetical protein
MSEAETFVGNSYSSSANTYPEKEKIKIKNKMKR